MLLPQCSGFCVGSSFFLVYALVSFIVLQLSFCRVAGSSLCIRGSRGRKGGRGSGPPENSQKYRVFSITGPDP